MPPPAGPLRVWWPTTQALDLVRAPAADTAAAIAVEYRRFTNGEAIDLAERRFDSLDDAFGAAPDFANIPTFLLVLPTRGPWSVVWNNSFLCDGYDSLCWNLTEKHGFETLHFSAHDTLTTFQAGTLFCARRRQGGVLVERNVYCGENDGRWTFLEEGDPLPEEDTAAYGARRKRDRLNEALLMALLARLGAEPWNADHYALEQPVHIIMRRNPPATILRRAREAVVR